MTSLAERIAAKAVTLEEGKEGTSTAGFVYVECFGYSAGSFWKADRRLAESHLTDVRIKVAALIAAELEPVRKALDALLAVVDVTDGTYRECEEAEKALALLEGGDDEDGKD